MATSTSDGNPGQVLLDRIYKKWAAVRKAGGSDSVIPRELVSKPFKLSPLAGEALWGMLPDLLMAWSEPGFDQRSLISFQADSTANWTEKLQGVLVCHTLNPTWESAALLAELGRALRVSAALGVPLRIMLAGITWARYNWVVQDTRLEDNLPRNLSWREGLYRAVNADVRVCEINNLPANRQLPIHDDAVQYSMIAEAIWGTGISNRRLLNDETDSLLASINLYSTQTPQQDLLRLSLIADALEPQLRVVRSAVTNLHRVDRETFLYFLLQYCHQSEYQHHLKLAIRRESDFDEPFREMERAFEHPPMFATQSYAYFSDYYFSTVPETGQTRTVHPYYFPSGTLYQEFASPTAARAHCLMIDDDDPGKIVTCLGAQKKLDRARFIADLLSLSHFLGLANEKLRKKVGASLKQLQPAFFESWQRFAVDEQRFAERVRTWSALVFTEVLKEEAPPYSYLPYLWTEMGVTLNDEAALVGEMLQSVREHIGLPTIWKPPA